MATSEPTTTVRFHLPPGVDEAEVFETLLKALKSPLSPQEKAFAEADAVEAREELTGLFERLLPQHEETLALLDEAIRRSRGKKRVALQAQRQKTINRAEWTARTLFNRYYRAQFENGKRLAGNDKPLHPNEREIIRRLANNEAQYAIRALLDAQTGEYTKPLEWRGQLYGNALDEAKWLGYLYGDLSNNRMVAWVLGQDDQGNIIEHCLDCLWLAGRLDIAESMIFDAVAKRQEKDGNAGLTESEAVLLQKIAEKQATQGGRWGIGVYRAQELAKMGIVPQAGALICTTNCKCHLEEAERPTGKTKQKESTEPWESILPKTPTMLQRETEMKRNEQLARLAEKWEHEHLKRRGHEVLKP